MRGLEVSFGVGHGERRRAVDGVSLTIYPGQTLAVVGESGCGKSVTALSLLRLLATPPARIDGGEAWLAGRQHAPGGAGAPGAARDLLRLDERALRSVRGGEIAMIFQEPMTSLNPVLTIGEQIAEAVLLHQPVSPDEAWRAAARALADVGIGDGPRRLTQYPHEFSGGMRQRVMIAMALACRPRLLVADEPTTALDVTVQAQILGLIRGLKRDRRLSVMLITHALGIVAGNADVVCVMYAGRVVEYARVTDLFRRPLHPYTRALLECTPRTGQRVERLRTVGESIGERATWIALDGPDAKPGVRVSPWWPAHEPPAGATPRPGAVRGEYALVEAHPGHWLGVWRTADLPPETEPDSDFARTDAGAAAPGGTIACAS
ncbi:MAG: ABC transporter ATP-binding protein [Phycisphaerales bacterium]